MSTRLPTQASVQSICLRALAVFTVLAMLLPAGAIAKADSASPFVGNWRATDGDGSDVRLSIAGPPEGPFRVTWTDDYITFCNGGPGLGWGIARLNEADPYVLEAELRAECKLSGASIDYELTWIYQAATDKLSSRDANGVVTIWSHPGHPLDTPPVLELRVNYGEDDWVESFYEAGHTTWVSVTDAEANLVATTELTTEPKDMWDGDTGFTSLDGVWLDPDGNPMEYAPDIQPDYQVFGWIDNGASAQVKIGTITGTIDLDTDSIQGTVNVPWSGDQVSVECLDWGSGYPPHPNVDAGAIYPNGSDTYACSWLGEWDILPGQAVGVGYTETHGNWVANSFAVPLPNFVAYVPDNVEGYDWPLDTWVELNINDGEYTAGGQSEERPGYPGRTRVLFELGDSYSLEADDYITMTDGTTMKDTVVTDLALTAIDVAAGTVSGIFDPAYSLQVWLNENQERQVPATSGDMWTATFDELPPGTLVVAQQNDEDGDGTSITFAVPDETTPNFVLRVNYGEDDWVESFYEAGHTAWVSVTDAEANLVATTELTTEPKDMWDGDTGFTSLDGVWLDPDGNPMEYAPDIQPDYRVYGLIDNGASAQLQIGTITGTLDLDTDSIQGTVNAPWFVDPVSVECLDWGSGYPPHPNVDGGYIDPDGSDTYSCSWSGEWDILPGQAVGVGYTGPDGNWVANSFAVPNPYVDPYIVASEANDFVWTDRWNAGVSLTAQVFASLDESAELLWSGTAITDENGFAILFELGEQTLDLEPGNYVAVTDGATEKGLVLEPIAMYVFDTVNDYMEGTAPAGADVWVAAGTKDRQTGMWVTADATTGQWEADFTSIPFDITEEMRPWSYAQLYDEDGDASQAVPPAPAE